jgi:apolipoprotein D and lipocalin family protein
MNNHKPVSASPVLPLRQFFLAWALLALAVALAGCTTMKQPLQTVAHVDLPRYMGDWYVIANIPNWGEKDCVDSIEHYDLRSDGKINNWFGCKPKSFDAPFKTKVTTIATVKNKETNAEWSVRFFKVIPVAYLVLDLDPEYQWTVVGHPSRKYGWIMARTKTLPDATYQELLAKLGQQGYDTTKFVKVPQKTP